MVKLRDEKYDLQELARRIETARNNHPEADPSFDAFKLNTIESVLSSCIQFHSDIPGTDQQRLIWRAIRNAATEGVIDEKTLKKSLDRVEKEYLEQPLQEYILVSSLSFLWFDGLPDIHIGQSRITFSESIPQEFDRKSFKYNLQRIMKSSRQDDFTYILVYIKDRTPSAAFNKVIDDIDYLRGIWNFLINRLTLMRGFFGMSSDHHPINKIISGSIHTLHLPDGKPIDDLLWYQPPGLQHNKSFKLEKKWEYVYREMNHILERIATLPYGVFVKNGKSPSLIDIFIRYSRALDHSDAETAFTKLWSVLEHLTGSPDQYVNIVKRVSSLEEDNNRNYSRIIMEHLRDIRNGLVHHDISKDSMYIHVYELKLFVENLFLFYLQEGQNFTSIGDACSFLDLLKSEDEIQQKAELLKRVLAYRQVINRDTIEDEL